MTKLHQTIEIAARCCPRVLKLLQRMNTVQTIITYKIQYYTCCTTDHVPRESILCPKCRITIFSTDIKQPTIAYTNK